MTATRSGTQRIAGIAVTSDGWPVPFAVVTVIDAAGQQIGGAAVDDDGRFVLDGLPAGPCTVITSAVGHTPSARPVAGPASGDLGRVVLTRTGALELPAPGRWEIDPVHSRIAASAFHLGITKVHGRLRRFTGAIDMGPSLETSTVTAAIESGSVDTDDEQRDAHLRAPDFLDVLRFGEIRFSSTRIVGHTADHWTMLGDLELKGVRNRVALDVVYHGAGPDLWGGERAGFSATTQLSRDDFDISWNQSVIAGIFAIGRTLRIEIDIEAVRVDG
ncbi:YceI family protein [Actinomycetospora corticicola]|uniref:Polyisoprenoid-binding protein YceI n=1 Tax=Actinomycetospora corticicola TaxID=663602 RepID=A0A7Y9E1A6_9PSEU|nr:polyisoprenoid-binding protein YceI [Actinomycetospora corticicola]